MRRREFIAGLGGAAAWPLTALAQQRPMPLIGFLNGAMASASDVDRVAAFHMGLEEIGFVEGRNVRIEYRWADGRFDRLPGLAVDLLKHNPTVMVVSPSSAALATKAATTTIPIVFVTGGDPVARGLVASLNRPGANVTGSANLAVELAPKRLQLLHELMPKAASFAVLADPAAGATQSFITDLRAAALMLGVQLVIVSARTDNDLEPAFATFLQQHVGAVLVGNSAFFNRRTEQFAALAARHALPAIYPFREYALAGGLMSYGTTK
jgi:putative ABC transport system substrate-binding protein